MDGALPRPDGAHRESRGAASSTGGARTAAGGRLGLVGNGRRRVGGGGWSGDPLNGGGGQSPSLVCNFGYPEEVVKNLVPFFPLFLILFMTLICAPCVYLEQNLVVELLREENTKNAFHPRETLALNSNMADEREN